MTQAKMNELDDKFKVRVSFDMGGQLFEVFAPLPDEFGMTVGSEFSAPFDANFLSGTMAKGIAGIAVAKGTNKDSSGLGSKLGIVTKKYYSNPEPSEISFDLQFEAYYDAKQEVINPVILLMAAGLGRSITTEKAKEVISNLIGDLGLDSFAEMVMPASNVVPSDPNIASRVFEFLEFVAGPAISKIEFGKVLVLNNAYISSVAPQFSNILDERGYPMSASCSVTAVLEKDPIITDDPLSGLRSFFTQDAAAGIDWGY